MKQMRVLILLTALAFVAAACGVDTPTEVPAEESAAVSEGTTPLDTMDFVVDPNLVNITWEWFRRTTSEGTEVLIKVPNPDKYTLFFNADGTFNAQLDCNGGSGAYATDGAGNIFMQLGPMTAAACPPGSLSNEMVDMFGPAQSYVYEDDGDTVIFKWVAGGPWDYYREAGTAPESGDDPLTGNIWLLTELNGETPLPDTTMTADFGEGGRVTGSSGCNNYTAAYEVDGNNININMSPAATTLMACPEPIMEQERAYLEALDAAERYAVLNDSLVLIDGDGNTVAIFGAVNQELAGTSWQVIAYNNGKEAVVSVIIGTEIIANFGEDGELTGNASCNEYFGPYETVGDHISMGPFGTTRKACQEPEGIMEQEDLYLAALETADTYRIEGDRMEMRTAEGAKVADFLSNR